MAVHFLVQSSHLAQMFPVAFEKRISELYLQQDKQKKEMQQEHALQKQQKDLEYKEKQA